MPDQELFDYSDLSPEEEDQLKNLESFMGSEEMTKYSRLVLAAWRLYWLSREKMIEASKGTLTAPTFVLVSKALSKAACVGFDPGDLKKQVKHEVMPFLKSVITQDNRSGDSNAPSQ